MKKIFLLIPILVLASCGQTGKDETDGVHLPPETRPAFVVPGDWKTFEIDNYSIRYPSTWTAAIGSKRGEPGAEEFILASPEDTTDHSAAGVSMSIIDIKGKEENISSYTKTLEQELKSSYGDSSIVESRRLKVGAIEFQKVLHKFNHNGTDIEVDLWFAVRAEKAYVMHFGCWAKCFGKYKNVGEQIMSTFTIK